MSGIILEWFVFGCMIQGVLLQIYTCVGKDYHFPKMLLRVDTKLNTSVSLDDDDNGNNDDYNVSFKRLIWNSLAWSLFFLLLSSCLCF